MISDRLACAIRFSSLTQRLALRSLISMKVLSLTYQPASPRPSGSKACLPDSVLPTLMAPNVTSESSPSGPHGSHHTFHTGDRIPFLTVLSSVIPARLPSSSPSVNSGKSELPAENQNNLNILLTISEEC